MTDDQDYAAPGETRTATAPPEAAGERVDAWLATLWPDLSRAGPDRRGQAQRRWRAGDSREG
ncbi:MAG TPA: hypothetical protein PKY87_13720 [Terricaulis sp.]|nr:hypothetical protein [Terricaulis sp.]